MTESADLRQLTPNSAVRRDIVTGRGTFATLVAEPEGSARATALLVPGYTGSKEDFAPIYDPLAAAGLRVVGLDQRGQYQSAGGDDPALYSVESLGADIAAVADTLGTPVHLLGHSFGGLTTRAAVIGKPSAFASLTLHATGPSKLDGQRRTVVELAAPMLPHRPLSEIYDLGQQLNAQDPSFVAPQEPLKSFFRDRFVTGSAASLLGMGESMLTEPDRVAELKATGVPVLVMYSLQDNAWAPDLQADMAVRLGAREVVVPGAMHSPAVENPAVTAATLIGFWDDVTD
ncbi:alpha/beta fold hydrolase [Antricoccus suffuscus]|nr:alpha/beta hydrolase [Antricoccus suffuscus]